MKRSILALAVLALLLAGCGGDFASPTTTDYQTTAETQTAAQEQSHNRQVCVGLLNIGSCNAAQSNVQNASRPAGSPAPAPGMSGAEMVGTLVLLCVAFVFCAGFAFIVMGKLGM